MLPKFSNRLYVFFINKATEVFDEIFGFSILIKVVEAEDRFIGFAEPQPAGYVNEVP